jgi:hypothetical protein
MEQRLSPWILGAASAAWPNRSSTSTSHSLCWLARPEHLDVLDLAIAIPPVEVAQTSANPTPRLIGSLSSWEKSPAADQLRAQERWRNNTFGFRPANKRDLARVMETEKNTEIYLFFWVRVAFTLVGDVRRNSTSI